jgi:tetratricopeptide (TPR) repeat protein
MSVDIYAPCPCGSGKKIKFCCNSISEEMDRIARLMEGNQPRVALQQLGILDRKHPRNAWIGTTRAMLMMDLNEDSAARDLLKQILEIFPDNELAIVLYAVAMIRCDGHEAAKKAIHRAFQKGAKKLPSMVCDIASSLAREHAEAGRLLAAREHLALALRLAPEDRRQELFVQLLELDGADEIPYPMRGSHLIPTITGSDELQKEVRKAQKYAAVGCWSIAADVFTKLANAEPERAELWHAAGLCRLWDGDENTGSESLHRAARLYTDIGIAVECETLAQLLDEKWTLDVIEECGLTANVKSVSRLLSILDGIPRIQRLEVPADDAKESNPVAAYVILNRDPNEADPTSLTLESAPRILGKVIIRDADLKSNTPSSLFLVAFRGPKLDESKAILSAAGEELLEWDNPGVEPQVMGLIAKESEILENYWHLSPRTPIIHRRELLRQFWHGIVEDKWPRQPLRALGGKTPDEASTDPSLKVPLLAAIYVLDSASQRRDRGLRLNALFSRLKLSPLPTLEVSPDAALGGLSIMQLHRLPLDRLNDPQLITVVNRSMLIRHDETLYEVLKLVVDRPSCTGQLDLARVYRLLSEIASAQGHRDAAIAWIDRGRQLPVPEGKTSFQTAWVWDMAELGTRLEDPSDPRLKTLLHRFVTYYGPKVPQIRPHIEQTLAAYNIPSPWESLDLINPAEMQDFGGIWSPGGSEPVGTAKKLWIPGQ